MKNVDQGLLLVLHAGGRVLSPVIPAGINCLWTLRSYELFYDVFCKI
jgi:hypothetical protein